MCQKIQPNQTNHINSESWRYKRIYWFCLGEYALFLLERKRTCYQVALPFQQTNEQGKKPESINEYLDIAGELKSRGRWI